MDVSIRGVHNNFCLVNTYSIVVSIAQRPFIVLLSVLPVPVWRWGRHPHRAGRVAPLNGVLGVPLLVPPLPFPILAWEAACPWDLDLFSRPAEINEQVQKLLGAQTVAESKCKSFGSHFQSSKDLKSSPAAWLATRSQVAAVFCTASFQQVVLLPCDLHLRFPGALLMLHDDIKTIFLHLWLNFLVWGQPAQVTSLGRWLLSVTPQCTHRGFRDRVGCVTKGRW